MLIPSILVLASQLAMPVADRVPEFNIERGCKIDSTATNLDVGLDESVKNCVRDEQQARGQIQAQWSQFSPSQRATCIGEASDDDGVPSSYVDLLTCLQDEMLAKKLKE